MKKITQDSTELLQSLSILESDWKDEFATQVINLIDRIPENREIEEQKLIQLLDEDFEVASTVFRLFLEMSKDEYVVTLRSIFDDNRSAGKNGFYKDKAKYVAELEHLLLRQKISNTIHHDYSWKDILIERLKAGRGSAIKGQKRGRDLEDHVEQIIKSVFCAYDVRCRFRGRDGLTTEKADFAIPSKESPEIIIEVKGYGATGSKQTDVIGDINRIIQEKRHDTAFLLYTDGVTWRSRESDFRKLVDFQNEGYIYRIYTKKMNVSFHEDLVSLRDERNIGK